MRPLQECQLYTLRQFFRWPRRQSNHFHSFGNLQVYYLMKCFWVNAQFCRRCVQIKELVILSPDWSFTQLHCTLATCTNTKHTPIKPLTVHLALVWEYNFSPATRWVDGERLLEALLYLRTPHSLGIISSVILEVFVFLRAVTHTADAGYRLAAGRYTPSSVTPRRCRWHTSTVYLQIHTQTCRSDGWDEGCS